MIQANELRIGNWIKTPEQEEKVYDNFFDTDEGVRFINDWNISVIKPIPLNEEWLIKFGFGNYKPRIFSTKKVFYIVLDHARHIEIHKQSEFIWQYGHDQMEIKYVHQLQNLYYALCGEELTIK
jgi:hypothetical protein